MPASADADATATQLTAPSTALVPMVAMAVCATVFTARTAAHLIQFFQFFMLCSLPLFLARMGGVLQVFNPMICNFKLFLHDGDALGKIIV